MKSQENNFRNLSSNYKPATKSRNITTSQNTYESNQMTSNEYFNGKQNEFEITSWFQGKGRQFRDLFDKTVGYFLDNEQKSSMESILAMLFVPLATERAATTTLRLIKQPKELKLVRRNPDFSGGWVMATNKGKYVLIEKSRHLININEINTPATTLESNGYELLPGFNESGESFLYEALKRSNNQGTAIKAIETAYVQLQIHDEPDINWLDWLKKHFEPKQHGNLWNKKVKREHVLTHCMTY